MLKDGDWKNENGEEDVMVIDREKSEILYSDSKYKRSILNSHYPQRHMGKLTLFLCPLKL